MTETDTLELADLLEPILPSLPQCPTPTAESALREAARDFYRDTGVWRQDLPSIEIREGTRGYAVTPPLQTLIEQMHDIRLPYTASDMQQRELTRTAAWQFEPPRHLVFTELPKDGLEVIPVAMLNLTMQATELPCDHANRYGEIMAEGALWHLYNMTGTPWAMPEKAEYHRKQFRSAIAGVRNQVQRHYRSPHQRVRPRPFI